MADGVNASQKKKGPATQSERIIINDKSDQKEITADQFMINGRFVDVDFDIDRE